MSTPLEDISGGVRLFIRLQPGASANKLDGLYEDADGRGRLKAKVTAIPEKGKANKALFKLLSKEFKIPASQMEIISGETDRNKTLFISSSANTVQLETYVETFADTPA